MNKTILTKNEVNKTITVERVFNANKDKVWQAYTDSDLLNKWWAPKPWKAGTKLFDFTPGGKWIYYMESPEGQRHYALLSFLTIDPKDSYTAEDSFGDENGVINTDLPTTHWETSFSDEGDATKVVSVLTFKTLEDLQKTVAMGFEQGIAMGQSNLDELIKEGF